MELKATARRVMVSVENEEQCPAKMMPEKVKVAREMYDSKNHTVEAIARTIGVSRKTVYRHLSPAN
jgi:DNA invertase Pin-like site-specific DNA recombinase